MGSTRDDKRVACRFCGASLQHTFVDLGMAPPCQSHVEADGLNHMEMFFPLHVCLLVKLQEYVSPTDMGGGHGADGGHPGMRRPIRRADS